MKNNENNANNIWNNNSNSNCLYNLAIEANFRPLDGEVINNLK